jgi:hypothetical protein
MSYRCQCMPSSAIPEVIVLRNAIWNQICLAGVAKCTPGHANRLLTALVAHRKGSRGSSRACAVAVECAAAAKVALVGAAGLVGQPLSLLLKMHPLISELALFDIANVAGVGKDLSHCNTPIKVRAWGLGGGQRQLGSPSEASMAAGTVTSSLAFDRRRPPRRPTAPRGPSQTIC